MKTSFHLKHRRANSPLRVRSLADRWAARKILQYAAQAACLIATTVSSLEAFCRSRRAEYPSGGFVAPTGTRSTQEEHLVLCKQEMENIARAIRTTESAKSPLAIFASGASILSSLCKIGTPTHIPTNL